MNYKIIIFIVTYILSFYYNYRWFSKAFSKYPYPNKQGKWSNLNVDGFAFFFTLTPGLNVLMAIFNLFDSPYECPAKKEPFLNRFFNVKK